MSSGTYIDDATLLAIEKDLDAAHKSFGHGDLSLPSGSTLKSIGLRALEILGPIGLLSYANAAAGGELMLGPLPVPADATIGSLLVMLAAFGVLPDAYEDHVINIGLGGLGAYVARAGATFGYGYPTTPGTLPGTTTPSTPTATSGYHVGQAGIPEIVGRAFGLPSAESNEMGGQVPAGAQRWYVKRG